MALVYKAISYLKLGNFEECQKLLEPRIQDSENRDIYCLALRAICNRKSQRFHDMKTDLNKVIELAKHTPGVMYRVM